MTCFPGFPRLMENVCVPQLKRFCMHSDTNKQRRSSGDLLDGSNRLHKQNKSLAKSTTALNMMRMEEKQRSAFGLRGLKKSLLHEVDTGNLVLTQTECNFWNTKMDQSIAHN